MQDYRFSTNAAQLSVGYLIKRAQTLLSVATQPVLEANGLTFFQYQILAWLRDGVAVNPKDISEQFGHDSGALTRVIDQLAERGLVGRVRCDPDRRKVNLEITPAGRVMAETVVPLVAKQLNLALAGFPTTDMQDFTRLLLKFSEVLKAAVHSLPNEGN